MSDDAHDLDAGGLSPRGSNEEGSECDRSVVVDDDPEYAAWAQDFLMGEQENEDLPPFQWLDRTDEDAVSSSEASTLVDNSDLIQSPHQKDAGSSDGLDGKWTQLGEKSQDKHDVQRLVFATYTTYKKHCASPHSAPFVVEGTAVPVFKRPPAYDSDFVRVLEVESRASTLRGGLPTFNMGRAICVIDSRILDQSSKPSGVSFGGPAGEV
jgi:hypothetical protein